MDLNGTYSFPYLLNSHVIRNILEMRRPCNKNNLNYYARNTKLAMEFNSMAFSQTFREEREKAIINKEFFKLQKKVRLRLIAVNFSKAQAFKNN